MPVFRDVAEAEVAHLLRVGRVALAHLVALRPGGPGAPPSTVLDDDAVAGAAASYLDTVSAWTATPGLALAAPTGSPDGRTAEVTLSAVVHPPVVNLLVPQGIAITATSEARAQLGR